MKEVFNESFPGSLVPKKAVIDYTQKLNLYGREIEVLKLFADDYTAKDIAEKWNLSVRTVEAYANKTKDKLGCRKMTGAIAKAIRLKIIE